MCKSIEKSLKWIKRSKRIPNTLSKSMTNSNYDNVQIPFSSNSNNLQMCVDGKVLKKCHQSTHSCWPVRAELNSTESSILTKSDGRTDGSSSITKKVKTAKNPFLALITKLVLCTQSRTPCVWVNVCQFRVLGISTISGYL